MTVACGSSDHDEAGGCGEEGRDECGVCGGDGKPTWYADFDHDGLGDPEVSELACERPEDYVDNSGDEDPECLGQRVFYADQDGDELGDPASPTEACSPPDGYVDNHDDLDPECASNDSDECGVCAGPGPRARYADTDGDGLGDPAVSLELCRRPSGWVNNDDDPEPTCASNDTDDCGICGGANDSKDCAGVCDGEAALDTCQRCSGGTTGVMAATADRDDDGFPDLCDQCLEEGVPRLIVQWTNVQPYGTVFGGPYTFQVVLFENGDFAYVYRDVEPFGDATVTVGHQGPHGLGAVELAFGSRYPTSYPIVYFRHDANGAVEVQYTVNMPWLDIRTTGTPLTLRDDGTEGVLLPFVFPYASASYSSVRVGANGFIALSTPYPVGYENKHFPATMLGAMLAPFWDDLNPRGGGSVQYQFVDGGCEKDCHGDFGGIAVTDACGVCSGGGTELVPDASRDCAGDCFGEAYLDTCHVCVGGKTGFAPTDPDSCPMGPDMLVDSDYLRNTIEESTVEADSCLVNEACVTGTGLRRIVRFGTRIANVGNEDVVVGTPNDQNPLWHWDPCHGHYHFEDYADYDLIDVLTSTTLPIGSKNGFCVLDLETWDPELAVRGCNTYDCGYQGISVGCADVYKSELNCQWVDITGVPPGTYDLRVTANPTREIPELDYSNNSATVRIQISPTDVTLVP